MGKDQLDIKKQYKFYLKRRNLFLFFIITVLIVIVGSYVTLQAIGTDEDLLLSLLFLVLLILLVLVSWYRQRFNYYVMKLEYYRMLNDQLGLIQLKKPIFTQSFIDQFIQDGFVEGSNHPDFILFYQFYPKIKSLVNSGQVLVCIVLAKKDNFDFYDEKLDQAIQSLYLNYKDGKKVKKQIVLQFKKFDTYNKESQDEINKIINFKVANNYLIHITIGYFYKQNQIYFLRPKKRYPNKYYYYAVELIKKYTGLM